MRRFLLPPAFMLLAPFAAFAIFYGEDSYIEIDRIPEERSAIDWPTIAKSVAILIPDPGAGELDLSGVKAMRARYRKPPLEPTYPYGDQPRLARLTAFLVAPDMIMTAGHAGIRQLERAAFIFDYTWDSRNKRLRKPRYAESEIYRCRKILLHRNDTQGDYALCQLDRPVTGRTPLTLEAVKDAAALDRRKAKMISAPDGTPLKLTDDGEFRGRRPSKHSPDKDMIRFFFHTLDNSGGSSGAPIFDATTGRVVGIQSGGDDNFTRVDGVVVPVRGDFTDSNLGRPLKGEWGSLIPGKALTMIKRK